MRWDLLLDDLQQVSGEALEPGRRRDGEPLLGGVDVPHGRAEGDRIHAGDPAVDDAALKTRVDCGDRGIFLGVLLVGLGAEAGELRVGIWLPGGVGPLKGNIGSDEGEDGSKPLGDIITRGEDRGAVAGDDLEAVLIKGDDRKVCRGLHDAGNRHAHCIDAMGR